jgi:hypothetical protein
MKKTMRELNLDERRKIFEKKNLKNICLVAPLPPT